MNDDTGRGRMGDFGGPRFASAIKPCAHLEGPGTTAAQFQQGLTQALKFAVCMRAHGITNFPDPSESNGQAPHHQR